MIKDRKCAYNRLPCSFSWLYSYSSMSWQTDYQFLFASNINDYQSGLLKMLLPSWSVPYESLPFHDFSSCGTRRFPDQESTVNTPCKSNQFFSVWTWIRDCVLPSSCPSSAETSGTSHWLLTAPLVGYEPGSLMTSQTSGESWKAPQDSEGLHEHPGQQK